MKKLSYASGSSDTPLLGMTIGDAFDKTVSLYPDCDALIVHEQNIRWTYKEFHSVVNDCAKALMSYGINIGDRVGIWSQNRSEWIVLQFATAKVGAILVNINPAYRIHELEYALNQSGCKMLVLAEKFKSSNYITMLLELAPALDLELSGEHLMLDKLPSLRNVIVLSDKSNVNNVDTWDSFMTAASDTNSEQLSIRQDSLSFDDPINIQYTSGTTGYPKGATLSHHNILNNGYFVARNMNFTNNDRLIIPVPLYHCFGMVMGNIGCVTHGAAIIYAGESFDPKSVLNAIETEKATALYGVPTMFIALLEEKTFSTTDFSSLRTGIMAGSNCPMEVMSKVQSLMNMKDVQIAYGMTETSPVSTQTRIGTPIEKQVGSVGQIHPHLEIKIINPHSQKVLPINQTGELCTRGYSVMLGYWNEKEKTNQAIDEARWMHTGDLAIMDDEGYVNIVGRIKDMIIRGGENIYPREIEEFLFTHPDISEVKVIGVPSDKYGEEVMAWITPKAKSILSADMIKNYCKGKISHFKIPRYYKFTDSFPMTVTGKIRKAEMRKISTVELGLGNQKQAVL